MKTIFTINLMLLIVQLSTAQLVDTINAHFFKFSTGTEKLSLYEPVVKVMRGDTIYINSDSAFIINNFRFSLYEKSKRAILSLDYSTVGSLIQTYEDQIMQLNNLGLICKNALDTISTEVDKGLERPIQILSESRATLKETTQILDSAVVRLDGAKVDLENAKDKLRKEKWLWGVSGVLTGLLTGLLLSL